MEYITNYTSDFAVSLALAANVSTDSVKNIRVTNITYVPSTRRRRLLQKVEEEKEFIGNENTDNDDDDNYNNIMRRDKAKSRRQLLQTVDSIEVSFDVVSDLTAAGYTTSTEFVTATSTSLNNAINNGKLTNLMEATCGGCIVAASTAVTYALAAQYPTLYPTPLPTLLPSPIPSISSMPTPSPTEACIAGQYLVNQ